MGSALAFYSQKTRHQQHKDVSVISYWKIRLVDLSCQSFQRVSILLTNNSCRTVNSQYGMDLFIDWVKI